MSEYWHYVTYYADGRTVRSHGPISIHWIRRTTQDNVDVILDLPHLFVRVWKNPTVYQIFFSPDIVR
jgi:hypothetical protein